MTFDNILEEYDANKLALKNPEASRMKVNKYG